MPMVSVRVPGGETTNPHQKFWGFVIILGLPEMELELIQYR